MNCIAAIVALVALVAQQAPPPEAGVPAPTPTPTLALETLLDRVHHALFARATTYGSEAGVDEVDPLLWYDSTWPADAAQRDAVLAVLDELLAQGDAVRSVDAVRRATLQRDAWSVFDWLLEHGGSREGPGGEADRDTGRDALLDRLAAVMRQVALSPEECAALPDVLALTAALGVPQGLLATDGEWVCVGAMDGKMLVPMHVSHVTGRSVFTVHLRLPGGRRATLRQLSALAQVREPVVTGPDGQPHLSRTLPQFPAGTSLALLRRALHMDSDGTLRATPIVESLQVRIHTLVPELLFDEGDDLLRGTELETLLQEQSFAEFVLDRAALHAPPHAGLRVVRADALYPTFASHGDPARDGGPLPLPVSAMHADLPPAEPVLRRCVNCHGHPGVYAWNSYTTVMTGPGTMFTGSVRNGPRALAAETPAHEEQLAVEWKHRHPSWVALAARW
jgi:hypothetical protein